MSTFTAPSPETIAANLALPLAARRALAEKAEGPGWRHYSRTGRTGRTGLHDGPWAMDLVTHPGAWIPASEAETLRVWAESAHLSWSVMGDELWTSQSSGTMIEHDGTYGDRLRAAAECCPVEAFTEGDR